MKIQGNMHGAKLALVTMITSLFFWGLSSEAAAAASCRLYETFDSNIPGDWSQVQNSGIGNWEWTDNPGYWANVPNSDDKVAIAESYGDGYNTYDVSLFTPSLDMTGRTSVRIDVDKFFEEYEYYGSQEARMAVYSGGRSSGNREEVLGTWTSDDPWNGEHVTYTIDPSGYDDPSHVYIAFWYTTNGSTYCRGFAIDNVIIDGQEPTVTTEPVTAVTEFTATAHGTIANLGFPDQVSAHGFCWNTTGSPTTDDDHTDEGEASATGPFASSLESLNPNTTYYLRAYATTPMGTSYGEEVSFTTETGFAGGSGTEADPYKIASLEDLRQVIEHPVVWGSHFVQTADIDAAQTQYWDDTDDNGDGILYNDANDATADGTNDGFSPIGNVSATFTGNYDGQGQTIDNLTIDRPATQHVGLFGIVKHSTITRLGVQQENISGARYTGGLVGRNWTDATVNACYSTGTVTGADSDTDTGGLVGENSSGTVSNCWSGVNVNGSYNVGGLVGGNNFGSTVQTCYSIGSVTGDVDIGGLLGYNSNNSTVSNSFWDTETTGMTTSAAGIGLTTAEMQAPLTFLYAGWDFADETANGADDHWTIHPDDNGGYPALAWQGLRNDIPYFGVTTDTVTDVTAAGANADNTVIEYATGGTISARGVCWNTNGAPTIADAKTTDDTVTGAWTSTVTGLNPDTTYHLRAYVTNDEGTTHYGDEITFTTPPFTGGGTAGDPFRFEDLEDLRFLVQNSAYWDKHIELQNDLDLSQTQYWDDSDDNGDGDAYNDDNDATADGSNDGWLPVGSAATPFTGTFDGQGFALSGLTINRTGTDDVGLFAHTGDAAVIRDLALTDVDITGGNNVGALAGTNAGEVQRCETTGEVTGTDDVGGLAGINAATGIIGAAYSAADVYGANRVGGLLGTQSGGTTTNSYSTGSVRGYDVLGGLIGHNDGGTVSNSYSTGSVNALGLGATSTGGLVAVNDGGTISNCFWDTDTSGLDSSAGGTGKTSAELRDQALFTGVGWDFTNTWRISDGITRPFLTFQDVSVQNGFPVKVGGDYKTRRFSAGAIRNNTGESITFTEYGILYSSDTPPARGTCENAVAGTNAAVVAGANLAIPDTTLADLPLGSTWYARAYATDGTDVWYGDVVRFTVPAPTVLLQSPRTQHSTTNTTPDFTWSGSATGTGNYTLYVGTTPDVYASGTTYDCGDAQSFTLPDTLTPGTTYYWGIELTDDVDSVQSAVQPLAVINSGQGGRITSGIDNANPVSNAVGGPVDIRLADLDGDGDLDIVAASRPDNAILWYENTDGAGTFGPAQTITTNAAGATRVQVGDLDSDGDLDVASASAGDDTIAWYANEGSGNFGAQQIITTNAAGARDVVLSDLDGDGDLDVVTASFYDDTIAWHENQGGGSFSERKVISAGSLSGPTAVNAADLNGDGAPDIIAFSKMDGRLAWYPNSGAGSFGAEQKVDTFGHNLTGNIEAVDMDGDGNLDLLVSSKTKVVWYKNTDGAGSFSAAQTVYQEETGHNFGFGDMAVAADLDGDGDPDVLSSGQVGHPSGGRWHRNDGTGNFDTNRVVFYYGSIGSRTPTRAGDIDGDGDLDVVAASRLNRRIDWFENRHGAEPFVVDGVSDQTANAGVPYTHTIPVTAFDDLQDGDTLNYTATLADGSSLPGWLSFDPATATFSSTAVPTDAATLEIEVTATDTTGATASDTFTLTVIDASGAPDTQVTQTGDSGDGSLRQVIADAVAGDTITFAPELAGNTVTLTSSPEGVGGPGIRIDKGVTIDGDLDDDGTPDITISGNNEYALFSIDDGDTACTDVVLDGLVLTDGRVGRKYANYFGTVTTKENLEMRNCLIKDASGPKLGTAVWVADGETLLHGCDVRNNVTRVTGGMHLGGPLYFGGARAEVVDCNIHGNSGYYFFGGGISAYCDLTVRNSTIRNNVSMFGNPKYLDPALQGSGGGGIYFSDADGSLLIEASTISGNTVATGTGGGVRVEAAAVTIRDSRITHNYALGSGGLTVADGELTLERSAITGNTCGTVQGFKWGGGNVDYYGAGIGLDIYGAGNVTSAVIDSCTISDNMTPEYTGVEESPVNPKYYAPDITGSNGGGSGIYGNVGTLTLRNSTLSGNTTYAGLGAVHRADTGSLPVYNIAAPTPGGLYLESGDAVIRNCTFARNAGGGVIVQNGTYTIESSIFSGNVQSDVGDAYPMDLVKGGGTLVASNSLIETVTGGHGLTDGTDGNIVGADPLLGPLAENGGPTPTHALLDGSPAIDTGSNPASAAYDQRGTTYYRDRHDGPDMGAVELQAQPLLPEIADQTATENVAFTFTIPAGSFDDSKVEEPLTYNVMRTDESDLPDWLSFDPDTRVLSGTPAESDIGTVNLEVTATDLRGATAAQTFDLTVQEGEPDITVKGGTPLTSIADGDTSPTVEDGTAFGDTTLHATGTTHTFTIRNDGSDSLVVNNISMTGAGVSSFTLSSTPTLPVTLPPGASATFDVQFLPSRTRTYTDTVSIASDDLDETPFTFAVSGAGNLPDSDNNGLPDQWEASHSPNGGHLDPRADPDGDGYSNRLEYAFCLDPHNADNTEHGQSMELKHVNGASYLDVTFHVRSDDTNLKYILETCTDLEAGQWTGDNLNYDSNFWRTSTDRISIVAQSKADNAVWEVTIRLPNNTDRLFFRATLE